MNAFAKQSGQILIIYLTTLFVGGSSVVLGTLATGKPIKEIEKSIKTHITEPSRQQQLLTLLKQWKVEGKQQQKLYSKQRKTLLGLIKNHAADTSAFKSKTVELLDMDKRTAKRLLDIQYGLRENMTREEWDKIFSSS